MPAPNMALELCALEVLGMYGVTFTSSNADLLDLAVKPPHPKITAIEEQAKAVEEQLLRYVTFK